MSPLFAFFGGWRFWLHTVTLGTLAGLVLVSLHAFLQPKALAPHPNSPNSTLPPAFRANVSQQEAVASYHFQEALIKRLPVAERPPQPEFLKPKRVVVPRLPFYAKYVPVPKAVAPNSVRLHLSQTPSIAGEVKIVNGRPMCAKKNDKPKKSKQNKRAHIDRECCLDPDEVPNPRCVY